MAGAFALLNGANRTTTTNNARMGATNLARELLEDARSVDYDTLTPTDVVAVLQAKVGVSGVALAVDRRAPRHRVHGHRRRLHLRRPEGQRRGDAARQRLHAAGARPGLRRHAGPRDPARRLPPRDGHAGLEHGQRQQDAQAGLADQQPVGRPRPAHHQVPRPFDHAPGREGHGFATVPTTTTTAGSVRWNSDGTPNGAGDATGGPTTWSTTWQLGPSRRRAPGDVTANWATSQYDAATTVLDGTYTITAQAFNDLGIAGDSRAAVLPLNRSLPITVTGFEAGRDFNVQQGRVPLEPEPRARHHRLRGLRLGPRQRRSATATTRSCAQTASVDATSCTAAMPSGNPTYYVVALDRTDITDTSAPCAGRSTHEIQTITSTEPDRPDTAARPPGSLDGQAEAQLDATRTRPRCATSASTATPAARRPTATTRRRRTRPTYTDPGRAVGPPPLLGDRGGPGHQRVPALQLLRLAGPMSARRDERGFTLIELLLVMSLALVLSAPR